jgi:glycosyltransferase involved in cell wall biosynthesis
MISVCIPVYNYDVGNLVDQVHSQIANQDAPSEIILIDDASDEAFRQKNRLIPRDRVTLIELDKNIGRAGIRNLFLKYTSQPNLLFLDCDTLIPSKEFISDYIKAIKKKQGKVICGGTKYSDSKPGSNRILHWNYGRKRESQPASNRNNAPNRSFMTANFMIERNLLKQIRFDERITGYGHEDSLFGYRLTNINQTVVHIDNPLIHTGLNKNREFLDKTDEGLRSLFKVTGLVDNDRGFSETITLLQYINRLDGSVAGTLVSFTFTIFGRLIRRILGWGLPCIPLYSFYKLGKYLSIREKMQKK